MRLVRSFNLSSLPFVPSSVVPVASASNVIRAHIHPNSSTSSTTTSASSLLLADKLGHLQSLAGRKNGVAQCRRDMQEVAAGSSNDRNSSHPRSSKPLSPDASLAETCARLHGQLQDFLAKDAETQLLTQLQGQVKVALSVAEEALNRYSLEQISMSYNGGKDCLVLLIIYLAALHSHYSRPLSTTSTSAANHSGPFPASLESIYIQPSHPFVEVDDFVESSSRQYHLSLASSTAPMKAAFAGYLDRKPQVKAIFVGTRRTDPHGGQLTHFDPTDRGWPSFMRIHPVIDWHYQEIWAFLNYFDIPYCSLYDKGYTSLGGTQDTLPNPRLAQGKGFRPASELVEDDEERLGRDVLISLDPGSKPHHTT